MSVRILVKKLSQSERLADQQMLAMLEWAAENPKGWHSLGNMDASKKAAELLAKRGVIEVWPETKMYRLMPKK